MITEQKQESVLRPFQMLTSQFETEIKTVDEALSEWNKARTISASSMKAPDNDGLNEKIQQLQQGKCDLEKYVEELVVQVKLPDVEFERIVENLRSAYRDFSFKLNQARAFSNNKYTIQQKNEINGRITAVNSSRMLNNADMEELQRHWRNVQRTENHERLPVIKKTFESRLTDWENLIAKKRMTANK